MIDPLHDELITLKEVAAMVPGLCGGRMNPQTVYRWATRGVRGVKLETVMVGGRRLTSREAVRQFIETLTAAQNGDHHPRQLSPSASHRLAKLRLRRIHGIS